MISAYKWDESIQGIIRILYFGVEIGNAATASKALVIETTHRIKKYNEAHNLQRECRQ